MEPISANGTEMNIYLDWIVGFIATLRIIVRSKTSHLSDLSCTDVPGDHVQLSALGRLHGDARGYDPEKSEQQIAVATGMRNMTKSHQVGRPIGTSIPCHGTLTGPLSLLLYLCCRRMDVGGRMRC